MEALKFHLGHRVQRHSQYSVTPTPFNKEVQLFSSKQQLILHRFLKWAKTSEIIMTLPNYSTEAPEHNFYIATRSCFLLVVNIHFFLQFYGKNQTKFQQ